MYAEAGCETRFSFPLFLLELLCADMVELADTTDLGSVALRVQVRVLLSALFEFKK